MHKKILIITDNKHLYLTFKSTIEKLRLDLKKFEFMCSFGNKELSSLIKEIDLQKDLEMILKSFDLIFSLHCRQLFPKKLIQKVKCINIHPGYNPFNRGWFPHVFSIIN